jgi:hypothetical protein
VRAFVGAPGRLRCAVVRVRGQTDRTPEKEDEVLREIRRKGVVESALKKVGIARSTWYGWLADDSELAAKHDHALKVGKRPRIEKIEDTVFDKAEQGDIVAAIFVLKTHRRDTYGDKQEISGPGGVPLTVVFAQREDGPA